MASLTHPHWEAVPPLLRDLLAEIGQMPFIGRFYLAGGTALALQLGHRVSVDLDFFSDVDEVGDDSRVVRSRGATAGAALVRNLTYRSPIQAWSGWEYQGSW
jgi:hypothetical protein